MKAILTALLLFIFFFDDAACRTFTRLRMPYDANEVRCIEQDATGMIWIGSKRGVFSFDGYNLHKMRYETNIEVESMLIVGKYLCVTSSIGILWLNLETEEFEDVHHCSLSDTACRGIALVDGKLWIGNRDSGLYSLDLDTDELSPIPAEGWTETLVYNIADAGDCVYVGAYECLSVYDKATRSRSIIDYDPTRTHCVVVRLAWDSKRQCVWICTDHGIFRLNKGDKVGQEIQAFHGSSFKGVCFMDDKVFFSSDNGLYEYDPENDTFEHYIHRPQDPTSLSNNVLFGLYADDYGNLWIGSERGLSISPAETGVTDLDFERRMGLNVGNVITHILQGANGDYWLGGDNGLIHAYLKNGDWENDWYMLGDPKYPIAHNLIRGLYLDRDNIVWLVSDGSIAHFDTVNNHFVSHNIVTPSGLKSTWAYSIYEDATGRLWIGTFKGGMLVVDKQSLLESDPSRPFVADEMPKDFNEKIGYIVFQGCPDEQGNLWLSTINGLGYVDVSQMTVDMVTNQPIDNRMLYADGRIWYTIGGQLLAYDVSRRDTICLPFNVKDELIYTFFPKDDEVWFSCANGIFYIDVPTMTIHQTQLPLFYCASGLYLPETRTMLLGGEDELKKVNLGKYIEVQSHDSLYISNLIIDGQLQHPGILYDENKNVRYLRTLHLKRNRNIAFELSSYRFTRNNEETYYFCLDDKEWLPLKRGDNTIVFNALSSGHHNLKICRFDQSVSPDAPVTSYDLYLPFPWYLQWWAFVVYVFAVALLLYRLMQYVQRRERNIIERQNSDNPFLLEVNQIIDGNMGNEDFNVTMLADKLNITSKQLNRKLKPLIGITPVTYIRRRRMQAAARLLSEQGNTVQEVMYRVGFSNASYFSKCFNNEYGINPSELNKQTN